MRLRSLRTLIRMECLDIIRSSVAPMLLPVAMGCAMPFMIMGRMTGAKALSEVHVAALSPSIIDGAMIISAAIFLTYFSVSVTQGKFAQEVLLNYFHALLCTGITTGDLWLAKVLASAASAYAALILIMPVDIFLLKRFMGCSVQMSATLVVGVFVLAPLLALPVIGVLDLLLITLRGAFLSGVFIVVAVILLRMVSGGLTLTAISIGVAALVAFVVNVCAFAAFYALLNSVPRQYVLRA